MSDLIITVPTPPPPPLVAEVAKRGLPGTDGREIELGTSATHVRWRYVGAASWTDLIALADLEGPPGEPGTDATVTALAVQAALASDAAAARTAAKVPASDPTGVTGADAISNIISLTQAEYDAIGSKSATTLYCIL